MHEKSFTQRRILKQAEAIALLVANVLRYRSMQVLIPRSVLIDKSISRSFVALILDVQGLREHLAQHVVILVVVGARGFACRIKRQQSITQPEPRTLRVRNVI